MNNKPYFMIELGGFRY